LLEYDEVDYYVKRHAHIKKRLRIRDLIMLAEAIYMAITATKGKEGQQLYMKWRHDMADSANKEVKDSEQTLFERLKPKKQAETLFSRLRRQ
jgi:hypothetical protein